MIKTDFMQAAATLCVAAAALTAADCPAVSFSSSISEDEFRGLPADRLVGQLGCRTYFQSIDTPANQKFIGDFQAWPKTAEVPGIPPVFSNFSCSTQQKTRVWVETAR